MRAISSRLSERMAVLTGTCKSRMPARWTHAWRALLGRIGRLELAVLIQEMRIRQRGTRPFAVTFGYVAILGLLALFVLDNGLGSQSSMTPADASEVGRRLFADISIAQLLMLCLAVPAYSSSSVTDERTKGTFPLLALTVLSSRTIVLQKLAAAVGEVVVLMFTSVPVLGIVFMLGGVAPMEVLGVYLVLLVTAVLLACVGMICSCAFANSRSSTFVSYLAVFVHMAGIPVALMWLQQISRTGLSQSIDAFPGLFLLMFAFVGAVFSLVAYGVLALILRRRVSYWRTRAFRMAVFGGAYALLMFAMSNPGILEPVLGRSFGYHNSLPLPLYVNPVMAVAGVTGGMGSMVSPSWLVIATVAFSIGGAYIMERISVMRFNALRGS